MGIQNINPFLKENCPQAFGRLPMDILKGYRLSIDAAGWFYPQMKVTAKNIIYKMNDPLEPVNRKEVLDDLVKKLINFIIGWQNNGVTLVWCWDGQPVPEKLAIAKVKRDKAKEGPRKELEELRKTLSSINPLSRSVEQITRYKQLLSGCYTFAEGEMAYLKNLIEDLGYPSLQARTEAEKLATALAREGLCYAVWSEDTDCYALGAPLVITGFEGMFEGKQMMSVVQTHKIIEGLTVKAGWGFTPFNFLDFCIMCGTDFNNNMKGVAVGNAWKLIQKYGIIEYIAMYEPNKPIATLNHLRVREIFAYENSGLNAESKELYHNKDLFNKNIINICVSYGLETLYQELIASTAMAQKPNNVTMVSTQPDLIPEPSNTNVKQPDLKDLIAEAEQCVQ